MHNPFQKIKRIEARPLTSLPAKFRKKRRTAWSDPNRQGAALDSFLEGPSFDRQGNLVAVTTMTLKGAQSINYAIPAEDFWK